MKLAASLYTFLLFNFRLCYSNMADFQHANRNCTNCRNVEREIEIIKQMEMIKLEIMRRLNISEPTTEDTRKPNQTTPKPVPDYGKDIVSYSEPPDNFTDENIVQFRLAKRTAAGRRLYVSSANLLVRVKYKRRKKRHNKNRNNNTFRSRRTILGKNGKKRTRKTNKSKSVELELFTVNQNGKPDTVITSVTSKLKKTKWLKLTLPRSVVQSALDVNNNTLQVYITCKGCGKRANIILVHKKRKRKRNRQTKKNRRLHKRRPYLITRVRQIGGKGR